MFYQFNHSLINSTVVDIYIIPTEEDIEEDDVILDITEFNFTWNVTDFKEDILTIQLDINTPPSVSRLEIRD